MGGRPRVQLVNYWSVMSVRSHPIGAPGDLIEGIEFTGSAARQPLRVPGRRGGVVETVEPGSPAARAGIVAGDVITKANENRLRDVIDYQFFTAEAIVALEVSGTVDDHRLRVVTILKDTGQPLGIVFTQPTFAPIRECNNHCPFCFIDQLPAEMRTSLYIRDDDYRYSFLFGNFVTLTNLNERDWRRLEEQRLGPLYVSVHATDRKLRRVLLGNDRAPDILAQLQRLFKIGIKVHTQVVVCPGINDGAALEETVTQLAAYFPNVLSIGIVPVGLTRTPSEILSGPGASCSRILPSAADLDLRTFEPSEAQRVVYQTALWQRQNRTKFGVSLVYASDEIYILAGAKFPSRQSYDDYPQYENGIGMVRDFLDDWSATKRRANSYARSGNKTRNTALASDKNTSPGATSFRDNLAGGTSIDFVCGEMIFPVLKPVVDQWASLRGIRAKLVPLANTFFGPRVRVSGLLTARDILANRESLTADMLILPEVMLDKTGSRLLDNVTPAELAGQLGKPVRFAGMMSAVDELIKKRVKAA